MNWQVEPPHAGGLPMTLEGTGVRLFGRVSLLAVFLAIGACSSRGVEIVRHPASPNVVADETDELRYGVSVKNYGNSKAAPVFLWADASFDDTDGDSCATGSGKGWFDVGSLEKDETWTVDGLELSSLTEIPDHCTCKRGTCTGSITFWLYEGRRAGLIAPGEASQVELTFGERGAVIGPVATPH